VAGGLGIGQPETTTVFVYESWAIWSVAIAMAQSAPTPIPSNRGDGRGGKAALSDLYSGALSRAFEIPPCADAPRSGGPC
jgi:hypothetical protein